MPKGRPPALQPKDKFEIWQQREAGISVKDCASYHNVSRATVLRVLAEMRLRFGRFEKLPNGRRARSHLRRLETPAP
jgi:Helix-turn-helix domain of resolvase